MSPARGALARALRAAWVATVALGAGGCGYDLDALRGPRDAGTDIAPPDRDDGDPTDQPGGDDGDDAADVPRPDARDAADVPTDQPEQNPCETRTTIDPLSAGERVGPSVVVFGDTMFAPSTLTPPRFGAGCPLDYTGRATPERVFRYEVQQGPSLYATTDAPTCVGVFDTIVYIRSTCDGTTGRVLACDDDDNVLSSCACSTAGECPTRASSAFAEGLVPGQVVYVVVDGFQGNIGRFRLLLTEGGVRNAAPATIPGAVQANRCVCADPLDTMVGSLAFPTNADAVTGSSATALAQPGDRLGGLHRMPFSRVAGAALELRLLRNGLLTDARCVDTRATLDLVVGGTVVQSFEVTPRTPTATPVRVTLQSFGELSLSTFTDTTVSLRLRGISPSGCGSLEFDRSTPGTLTVLGQR